MKEINKNRKGFKYTPMGWIPNEWKNVTFEEVLTGFTSGSTPSRNIPQYYTGDVLWITSGELNYNVITDTIEKITEQAIKNANLKMLEPGTFLMAITGLEAAGTRGSCAIVGKPATTNQSCMALLPKDQLNIHYFFQYYCNYGDFLAFKYCQGTKQQSYNGTIVRKLPFILPSLPEQIKINKLLQTWDKAIETTQNLITTKDQLKKGLMQQLLTGKKRLPGFNGEWCKVRIGEVVKEVKRPIEWDDDKLYNLISVRRRSGGVFYRESLYGHEILTKGLYTAQTGDFLISKMQIVHGASGLVKEKHDGMFISGSYIALHSKDEQKLDMEFFDWLSKTPEFYHLCYISSYGVHIEKMTFDFHDFLQRRINIPSDINEQKQIVVILNTLVNEIDVLKSVLELYREQKKGLMQILLTGAVRVKV